MTDGESKSSGFAAELATNIGGNWTRGITAINKGVGGYSLQNTKDATDAHIAAVQTNYEEEVKYLLLTAFNGEVLADHGYDNFINNTLYIVDAWKAAYPNIQVYLTREWSFGYDAGAAQVHSRIDDVIALRPTFVYAGPDEVTLLVPPDDGATYYSDGMHPTAAGYHLLALDWQSRMGL